MGRKVLFDLTDEQVQVLDEVVEKMGYSHRVEAIRMMIDCFSLVSNKENSHSVATFTNGKNLKILLPGSIKTFGADGETSVRDVKMESRYIPPNGIKSELSVNYQRRFCGWGVRNEE